VVEISSSIIDPVQLEIPLPIEEMVLAHPSDWATPILAIAVKLIIIIMAEMDIMAIIRGAWRIRLAF
jgi:hypothetical protein